MENILQERNALIQSLKTEGDITDELLAKHEALNAEIQRRIDINNAYDNADVALNKMEDMYDTTDMYDMDEVSRMLEARRTMLDSISPLAFEHESYGDFLTEDIAQQKEQNALLEKRIGLLGQVRQGLISIDDVDDILKEGGSLEDKLERLGDFIYTNELGDKIDKDDDDDITNRLEAFEAVYDRIVLKLANGKNIEILPDTKGLNALVKLNNSDDGTYGPTDIEDVVFVRKQEQAVIQQTNQELQEQVNLQKQINSEEKLQEYDVDGDIARVNQLLEKEKLTYEEILALVKEHNNESKIKHFADAEDWDTVNKIGESHTDIAKKLVPIYMMGMGSDSPDKWLGTIGVSAEEAAQKLYELYNRLHGIDEISDELTDISLLPDDTSDKSIVAEIGYLDNLLAKVDEVREAVGLKTQAFTEEGTVVDSVSQQEIESLNQLKTTLIEIEQAIQLKTQSFVNEGTTVNQVVDTEISALKQLYDLLATIQEIVSQINLSEIDIKTGNLESITNNANNNIPYLTDKVGAPASFYRGVLGAYSGVVSNRASGGTFFTNSQELASHYAKGIGKIEKVNISLKNPLEIDANGANWDGVRYLGNKENEVSQKLHEMFEEFDKLGKALKNARELFNEYKAEYDKLLHDNADEKSLEVPKGMMQDYQNSIDSKIAKRQQIMADAKLIFEDQSNPYMIGTTDEIAEMAKKNGYDGVIFKNIYDSAMRGYDEMADVVVTFEQEQIRYVETIQSTLSSSIDFLKKYFSEYIQYLSLSQDDIKEYIVKANELNAKKRKGFELTDAENKFLSDNVEIQKFIEHEVSSHFYNKKLYENFSNGKLDDFYTNMFEHYLTSTFNDAQNIFSTIKDYFGIKDLSPDQILTFKADDKNNITEEGYALNQTVVETNTLLNNILGAISDGNSSGSSEQTPTTNENSHYVTDPKGHVVEMYRGISDSYGGLVSNRYHGGTFFTDSVDLAREYAGEMGKVEKVLLSMKNPLEIDAHGGVWNRINNIGNGADEASKKIHNLIEELDRLDKESHYINPDDHDASRKYLDKRAVLQQELDDILADKSNPYTGQFSDTNQIAEKAKQAGYDGVIFKNLLDSPTNNFLEPTTVMITFAEQQVHYIETLGRTFEVAMDAVKQRFGDVETYMNTTEEEASAMVQGFANIFSSVKDWNHTDDFESSRENFLNSNALLREFLNQNPGYLYESGALFGMRSSDFDPTDFIREVSEFLSSARREVEQVQEEFNTTLSRDNEGATQDANIASSSDHVLESTLTEIKGILSSILSKMDHNFDLSELIEPLKNVAASSEKTSVDENPHYVTDPQGNPVTMYRGIRGAYGGLVSNRYHGGTFSSSDLEVAKTYAGVLGKVEKVQLSMKNPFEIDGNGKLWKNLDYIGDNADEASKKLHELHNEIKLLNQEIEQLEATPPTEKELKDMRRGLITETPSQSRLREAIATRAQKQAEVDAIYADDSNPYGIKTTNEIVELAKANGYDGVIFKDIVDSANKHVSQASTVMVTFTQDQIHYLETIRASFDDAIESFKRQFGELTRYIDTTDDQVKEAVTQLVGLRQKVNAGEITDDEYKSLLSQNSLMGDVDRLTDRSGLNSGWMDIAVQNGDQVAINRITSGISSFITQMREKLQKIAEIFEKADIPLGGLLNTKESDVNSVSDEAPSEASPSSSYALDATLKDTNGILENILSALNGDLSLTQLTEALSSATTELKNVANGIVEHQKAQQADKGAASARIANNYGQLSSIASNAISAMGDGRDDSIKIKGMKALANDVVRVEGAVRDASGSWNGFIVDVNEANKAVITATNKQSEFAKELNEAAEASKNATTEAKQSAKTSDQIAEQYKKKGQERELQKIIGQVNLEKGSLGFDFYARGLNDDQQAIVGAYDALIAEVDKYEIAVKNGEHAELDAINKTKEALFEKIDAYKQQNNIINAGKTGNKKAPGATVVKNATTKYNALSNMVNTDELKGSEVVRQHLEQYTDAYRHLVDLQKQYKVGQTLSAEQEQEFNDARVACNNYAKDLEKLLKLYQKSMNEGDISKRYEFDADFKDTAEGRQKVFKDFLDQYDKSSVTFEKFDDNYNKMIYTVNNGDGTFVKMTATINSTKTAIDTVAGEAKEATGVLASFFNELKGKFKSISAYLISSLSIHEVWQQVRRGVEYVKEIDGALTELKKVTDSTNDSYQRFLRTMSQAAGVTGSTVKDLTSSAADWARLGYNMEQAGELAVTTSKLLNVSEFTSVDEATSALISSLQAFTENGEDVGQKAEKIVDILNHIGNRYPVATNELADGLATSSAALVAANNSIEEQVALLSAGNATMQDISTVASGLKIVAARLRGTTTDVDDDADSAITNVSKLQKKIEALTAEANGGKGINILNEQGEYKSTYEILAEISKIFDKMDDVSSAALLELIAGKNRSSVVAAILQNGDVLENAYSDAFDSLGSSQKELDVHLDSIQGRIDLFTNSLQTLWMNLLDSNVIKGVVDAGTALIKFLDTVAGKITAIITVYAAYQKIKNGVKFVDMFNGASNVITNVVSSLKSLFTATKSVDVATIHLALSERGVNEETIANIMSTSLWSAAAGELNKQQIKQAASTLTTAFNTGKLTAAQYLAAMSSMGLKTALQGLWTVLKANPFVLVAAVTAAAVWALDAFTTTAQEAADAAKEAFDEIQSVVDSTKSAIQELEGELSTLQDKIDELNGKEVSFADNKELEKLKAQRAELEHSLKIQQQLLELQQDAKNKQAVASMKAYTKAASQGAEDTQKAWKTAGAAIGAVSTAAISIAALILSGGAATPAVIGTIAAGSAGSGAIGYKQGEIIGSAATANDGTYDSWYETYTKALDTAREEEQKALKKYQKDSSNIDKLDKWQEAQQKTADIETEMYEHLSQMQQYYNGLEYGMSDELDQELNTWYNFLDKLSISQRASGSEVTALDRIFGENASKEIQDIRAQIQESVKTGKEFDFESAINGSQELKSILDYVGLSAENVKDYFTQIGNAANSSASKDVVPVQTYSDLFEDAEKYNELLAQTSEIILDNTKVTEDYKQSIIDLVGSEAEVNKYFDENNKLIVKDAKGLNDLVKASRKNTAQNTQLAKSQAKLQYYELYKKMRSYIDAEGRIVAGKKNEILALYEEMNALEKTIAKYSRLESQLLSTSNAYDKFELAQESDSETDYIGSVENWISALGEAFSTAELGTETAQAAIAGLVPESVYSDLDTVDEKMAAIYKYFKEGKLSQYFDIQFNDDGAIESVEMKLGNLRKFIEDGLSNGTFIGSDWMHFDLSDGINSLEDFQKAMGVTEEVAFAFIKSIEDHDIEWLNGDYSSLFDNILPDNLANDIYENTSAMADLAAQLANGKITAEEYTSKWNELSQASANNAQKARENASAWIETNNSVEAAKEKVQTLASELEDLYEQGASESEIKVKTDELEMAKNQLTETVNKLSELETMDAVVLQVALDQAQAEIDAFEKENSTLLTRVKIVQDTESGVYNYEVKDGATLSESEAEKLKGYIEDVNAKFTYENEIGNEVIPYEDQLDSIEEILQNIYDSINGSKEDYSPSSDDGSSKTSQNVSEKWDEFWNNFNTFFDGIGENANALKEKLATFFTETVPEKWEEFWNSVSEFFAPIVEQASILKEKATTFFTQTIPEKWDEFWVKAAEVWGDIQTWADATKNKVVDFFTVTIPEKWEEFWDKAGEVWDNVQEWADTTKTAVTDFFTITLPEKWSEFWDGVDAFFTENIPYAIGYIAGAISKFFTETIPEKWAEFWDGVEESWSNTKEWASAVKESVVKFFTDTIPSAWADFWESAGDVWDGIEDWAIGLKDTLVTFFTETIPTKWTEFWARAGEVWDNVIDWASATKDTVVKFFTETIPEKWTEFWDGVNTYIDETILPALQSFADTIKLFFTDTIPTKWSEFWTNIGNFITETIVPALQIAKDKLSEFFFTTIPAKWSEFWSGVGSFITETVPQALEDVKKGVTTFFTVTVPNAINGLWTSIASWISEKASTFWSNLKSGFTAGKNAGSDNSGTSGPQNVNGTAHVKGTAYKGKAHKSGDWGLPTDEHNSLVGELGTELVWIKARYLFNCWNILKLIKLQRGS